MSNNEILNVYPDLIKNLPEADIDFKGVRGWISQAKDHQIVFFDIEPIGEISAHSHSAQWGIVIDGEMDLTIDLHLKHITLRLQIFRTGLQHNLE